MRGERALLATDAYREHPGIEQAEPDRRPPCAMHERNGEALDDDRQIVRMSQETKRPRPNGRHPGHDDDAHVPPLAQSKNDPVAKKLGEDHEAQHGNREPRKERTVEKNDLERASDEKARVKRLHVRKVARAIFDAPLVKGPARVPPANEKLDDALERQDQEKREIGRYHCSSTSSEQNPGPIARRRP